MPRKKREYDLYNFIKLRAEDGSTMMLRRDYLVASTFIPNPNEYQFIHHKDGDSLNCLVENLEWAKDADDKDHGVSRFEDDTDDYVVDNMLGYNIRIAPKKIKRKRR